MKLSSHEEYGLRCLLQLGRREDSKGLTLTEISDAEGISAAYVAKLMRALRRGGLVKSTRGQVGGYTLARPADQITVSEALTVLGGRLYDRGFCERHTGMGGTCMHSVDCAIRVLWRTVQESVDSVLAKTSLHDLLRSEQEMVSWVTISPQFQRTALPQ
jgi:Rrf2 family protein